MADPTQYSFAIPISAEVAEDMVQTQRLIECQFFLLQFGGEEPVTEEETKTGWRTTAHKDHEHRYAVGWRAEEQRKEADAKREAEMAACPYVECTCGHHEDT